MAELHCLRCGIEIPVGTGSAYCPRCRAIVESGDGGQAAGTAGKEEGKTS